MSPYICTREIELIQDRMREFWKFRDISRSYMLINGHRDRTFYQFPYSSMTFHVLSWVLPVRSTTFQSVPRPSSHFYDLFQQGSVSNASFLMVTRANSFVSLLERMFSNPSVFCLNPSVFRLNPSVFPSNSGEVHYKFFSTDSGVDAHFNDLSPGTEPRPRLSTAKERVSRASLLVFTPANSFVSLVERMDILELEQSTVSKISRETSGIIRSKFAIWIPDFKLSLQKWMRGSTAWSVY